MIIRELILEDELLHGVQAISLVTEPAIESNFIFFNKEIELRTVPVGNGYIIDLDEFWKYTADPEPETIATSHEFCKFKAGYVHHISEIRAWDKYKTQTFNNKPAAFIKESDYFKTFNGSISTSFNIDQQIYNCRHHFRRVRNLNDIPAYKQQMYKKKTPLNINQSSEMMQLQFKVDKEKKEIVGAALIPNKMIYRNNVGGTGQNGYVYLSKKTIKQVKEAYGMNRTLTIQHESNITGRAILLASWIYPDDRKDTYGIDVPEGTWMLKYKIIDDKLWQVIKDQKVMGLSIEGSFSLK